MRTKTPSSILDNIEIAKPCSASWDDMKGNERLRDCSQCKLSVYNISEMSKREAEELIRNNEGRLCIRLYRRMDGTLITDDCPVALRRIRKSLRNFTRIAAAALSCLLTFSGVKASNDNGKSCGVGKVVAGKEQASVQSNSQVWQGAPEVQQTKMGQVIEIKQGEMEASPKQARPGDISVKPKSDATLPEIKSQRRNSAVKLTNPTKKSPP